MREINEPNKPDEAFSPTACALSERAAGELRRGQPVIIEQGSAIFLVFAAERITPDQLASLRALTPEAPRLVLTVERARTLKIPAYTGEAVHIPLAASFGRDDIHAAIDPADDLDNPLKGPYPVLRDAGALADLAEGALQLAKRARLLPAIIGIGLEATGAPDFSGLVRLELPAIYVAQDAAADQLEKVIQAHVPLENAENTTMVAFRPRDGGPEHFALVIGEFRRDAPVLVRVHSECFTGDLLGSLKCDCGTQLREAIARISAEGGGVLLYLAQEGRGIGLLNKLRAYHLQDQGFDTVEANERLGFKPDERQFAVAAAMLTSLGIDQVRLMTNNPDKLAALAPHGVTVVERVPHSFEPNPHNRAYLETKTRKSGHLL